MKNRHCFRSRNGTREEERNINI
jgi:hypothetical protein